MQNCSRTILSIVSRGGVAIWSKTNFGPACCQHPQSNLLLRICTVPKTHSVFLNASWKLWSVRVFSTICTFASITSIVSKWRENNSHMGPSQASRVGVGWQLCSFWLKIPWWKRKCEMTCSHDATAISFTTKLWHEVFALFHAVAVKRHSTMQNSPFGLPWPILCKQSPWCQRKS